MYEPKPISTLKNWYGWFKERITPQRLILYLTCGVVVIVLLILISISRARERGKLVREIYSFLQTYGEEKKESKEKYPEFEKTLQRALSSPAFPEKEKRNLRVLLADLKIRMGKLEEAEKLLREEIKHGEGEDYFYPWVGYKLAVLLEEEKKVEEAIKIYKKIKDRYPDHPLLPQTLLGLARCLREKGKVEEAKKTYEVIITRYPLSEEAEEAENLLQILTATSLSLR